jgi:hypothetical protein
VNRGVESVPGVAPTLLETAAPPLTDEPAVVNTDAMTAWRQRQASTGSRVVRAPVASTSMQQDTASLSSKPLETASVQEEKAEAKVMEPVQASTQSVAATTSRGDSYAELMAQLEALRASQGASNSDA